MTRLLDRLLVVVYFVLAAGPVIAMLVGLRGRELHGVLPATPRPRLTVKGVLSEKFQHGVVSWFESNLGLKGTSIGFDNALLYFGFGETKFGSPVKIGEDGVLFQEEDIGYFSKHGAALPTPAYVEAQVTQIAELQNRLRDQGRAFIPMIIPAKTTVWRDKVPAAWALELGEPRPSDVHVYQAYKAALDKRGVRYVDVRAMFASSIVPRALLFGPDARHWSAYGVCLAMQQVIKLQAELLGRPAVPYACPISAVVGRRRVHDDFDLWRLLNAYKVQPALRHVPAVVHEPPAVTGPKSSVLFVGTSFCWGLLRDADDSGRFGRAHMNYYNQTFVPWPEGEHFPVRAGTPEWREATRDKDLYVLDLFEGYLGAPGAYVELFLADFRAELDRSN